MSAFGIHSLCKGALIFEFLDVCLLSQSCSAYIQENSAVISELIDYIAAVVAGSSVDVIRSSPKLLANFDLNPKEMALFDEINKAFLQVRLVLLLLKFCDFSTCKFAINSVNAL